MRRGLWLIAIAVGGVAHADPRDEFGLETKAEPPVDCTDGKDFGCAMPTNGDVGYALSTWLSGSYLLSLPVGDATHDQVAGYALGAGRTDGGPSFGGATGLENRWTIDGAPADDPITGGASTKLPLAFLDGLQVTAGGFAAKDRASTGGVIDARLKTAGATNQLDAYVWGSVDSTSPTRALLPGEYLVRRVSHGDTPSITAAVVDSGPLGHVLGGTAWFVAGIAPSLAHDRFTWRTTREVDANGDGTPDANGTAIATTALASPTANVLTYTVPAMLRVGLDSGVQHVELSAIGQTSHNVRFLGNSTVQAAGTDLDDTALDGIATYHADWPNTHVRIQASWHRSTHRETAHDASAANIPQQLSAYVPGALAEDPGLAAACSDTSATDPYPRIANCPVPAGWFASGGAGPLTNTTTDRPTITADVAHHVSNHTLRAGVTDEDSRVVVDSSFTGGQQLRSLFVGHQDVEQYLAPVADPCPQDTAVPCQTTATSTLTYRTRYAAGYVEDTWSPMRGVLIDGGLRDEYMQVGSKLTFDTELAPRFGATWDFLGGGKSRAWLSAGRTAIMIPAGIGEMILHTNGYVHDITSTIGDGRAYNLGNPIGVGKGIAPPQQDELTAGVEVALYRAVRVTAWTQERWLRRGIDTTATYFDNPGRDGLPEATRQSQQVGAQLETAPTSKLALRVGVLWGRVTGTWTGAYDPRQGAVLYGGSDYDTDATNQRGRLPQDPGTRLFVEAQRRGAIGGLQLSVAMRLTAGTGAPRDVLADNGEGVIFLLPRGAAGNGPLETNANLRFAVRWHGTDLMLDLFNLFDRSGATAVDTIYTDSGVRPISGGTAADLTFLKNANGAPAIRSASYLVPTAYQAPFGATLGIHRAF